MDTHFTGLPEKIPLRRNRKSAWSRGDRQDSDPEETAPAGAGTCGYGGDGGDGDVDDGGCQTPVTHFHPRCRGS